MHFQKVTHSSRTRKKLVECISVARVRPSTSKGITDLLLPHTSPRYTRRVPLRNRPQTIWFGKLAYNLFTTPDSGFWDILLGIGFAFLSLFMLKSLFFLNKREENPLHKFFTKEEEPVLFDYLYKLADEAGAPRPHKVFLTDRVNASVSYDISLINLLFPSKKSSLRISSFDDLIFRITYLPTHVAERLKLRELYFRTQPYKLTKLAKCIKMTETSDR